MRCVTQSIHTESDVVVIHLADCMHKKNRTSVIRMWLAFGLKTGPARGVTVLSLVHVSSAKKSVSERFFEKGYFQ